MSSLWKALKASFVSGVIVVVPIIVTIFILRFLFNLIDGILQPLIVRFLGYDIPGLGILATLLLVLLVGIVTKNLLGNQLVRFGEQILARLPLISSIYQSSKQLLEAFYTSQHQAFKDVVLVEYPSRGLYSIGFVTNRVIRETDGVSSDLLSVYMPSTPTPMSGFLIFVSPQSVQVLDMTIEEGIKQIVSGGVVTSANLRVRTSGSTKGAKELT